MIKVLNLYAGIGGNRKLWEGCEVTAVEYDSRIASVYQVYFPKDTVIVADAHEYLLNNYNEFDFIWASPPCPTHSRFSLNVNVKSRRRAYKYPDMTLYQEILLLETVFKGDWCVENVKPYYSPLIKPTFKLQRHLFWSNKVIPYKYFKPIGVCSNSKGELNRLSSLYGFDIRGFRLKRNDQVLRNCVDPKVGEYIFNQINRPKRKAVRLR